MKAAIPAFITATVLLAGCGSSNRLADYSFNGTTMAIVQAIPSRPDVFTYDHFFVDSGRPIRSAIRIGTQVIVEAEAKRMRAKLEDVNEMVDVPAIIADRTLEQVSLQLRSRPVNDPYESDFVLDIRVSDYGIVADSWTAGAEFLLDARMMLIDGPTGRRIWKGHVRATEPIRPTIFRGGPEVNNVITAATLSSLSVEEIAEAFEALGEFAADRLSLKLQNDFIKSRR